jgi:hypothetical protein
MKYEVLWSPFAEQLLAELWYEPNDRYLVSEAARQIDENLARSPHSSGESRGDGTRILLLSPLGVLYEIFDDERQVVVRKVWSFSHRQE